MKRNWPFILLPSGSLLMLFGSIYYMAFVGFAYEKPAAEVSAHVATQAHISFVISWLGACVFFGGLLGSAIRLIIAAKLSDDAGKTKKSKITLIALVSAFVISILCIVSVMSGGFFIFGPMAVVSAWLLKAPMWVASHAFQRSWITIIIPLFIQFFAIIWFFVWFIAHKFRRQGA